MFDIGFTELVLVGIIALIILGPERLPHAATVLGRWVRRMQGMISELKDEFNQYSGEASDSFKSLKNDIDDAKAAIQKTKADVDQSLEQVLDANQNDAAGKE